MIEKTDILSEAFSRYATGFSLSKAILEDYAKVIAKFENIPEQEVTERIQKRSKEIFDQVQEKQKQQVEQAS